MTKSVLVTGGAGFVGSHLVDELVSRDYRVRVLDRLEVQVHGPGAAEPGFRPEYLHPDAELQVGDTGDPATITRALEGVDVVFHQAAAVGVGQSMYEIDRYVARNTHATAVLLQAIVDRQARHPLDRLLVASSMSIYGEGEYRLADGTRFAPSPRPDAQLDARTWEMLGPDGGVAEPVPTTEDKALRPTSVYALTKRDQEEYCLLVGATYGIPTVALRYFNIYGPRQALSNPYTGVAAIFGSCLLSEAAPTIYEDGLQTRDFIHVRDIVTANLLGLEADPGAAAGQVFNVGTGRPTNLLQLHAGLQKALDVPGVEPQIPGRFRAGDIRHCYADIAKISAALGFEPTVDLETGLSELAGWMRTQEAENLTNRAAAELERKGLVH
ncbi:MAG: NAD-dependent epimerase/dehydratase family protein [Actinobacteria bacterium]|nr:NAD-dependent epimerase/dehydratase family protein [Actinomycetota bacterium]